MTTEEFLGLEMNKSRKAGAFMRRKLIAGIIMVLLIVPVYQSYQPVNQVHAQKVFSITKKNYGKILKGWTKTQVMNLLGSPQAIDNANTKHEVWKYWNPIHTVKVSISFSGESVVSKYWDQAKIFVK